MSHAVPLFEKMLHCDWNGWTRYGPQVDARLLFIALSHQFIIETRASSAEELSPPVCLCINLPLGWKLCLPGF